MGLIATGCDQLDNPLNDNDQTEQPDNGNDDGNDNNGDDNGGNSGDDTPTDQPEDIFFSLDQEEIVIDPEGGDVEVVVYSNYKWEILGSCDWCTPSIDGGEANEDGEVVVFSADVTYENREATFIFRCAEEEIELVVKQSRKEVFTVKSDTSFSIPHEGGNAIISYQTSVKCEMNIPQQAKGWISIADDTRALTENNITLQIEPNYGAERSAEILVRSINNKFKQTFLIHQDAAPLKVNIADDAEGNKVVNIKASGETKEFNVTGPDWTATASASWLKVYKDELSSLLVIRADAHYAQARSAEVVVQSIDGEESQVITVQQEGGSMPANALTFKPDENFPELCGEGKGLVHFLAHEATYHFEVVLSNTEQFVWYIEIDDSIDWINSAQTTPRKESRDLYLNIKQNTTLGAEVDGEFKERAPRTAVIYVVCEYRQGDIVENSVRYELTVKQSVANRNEDPYIDPNETWD